MAPKYRNPENPSETWAGRGLRPRWLVAAIKGGKKLEDFAIGGATKGAPAPRRGEKSGKPEGGFEIQKEPPKILGGSELQRVGCCPVGGYDRLNEL